MTDDIKDLPHAGEQNDADNSYMASPVPSNPTHNLPAHPNTDLAAENMAAIAQFVSTSLTARDMLDVLRSALARDGDGHSMLFNQAQALDTLFHRLSIKAFTDKNANRQPESDTLDQTLLHLALRTQKQCRSTIEVITVLQKQKKAIHNAQCEDMFKTYNESCF